jgi:hypothetical protein
MTLNEVSGVLRRQRPLSARAANVKLPQRINGLTTPPLRSARLVLLCCCLMARDASAREVFHPEPWLQDLEQVRQAFATKYADLEWEVSERDLDLTSIFARAREQIATSHSDTAARAALVALTQQFGERHVQIRWKSDDNPGRNAPEQLSCSGLGYDTRMQAKPLAALMPGAVPLPGWNSDTFPLSLLRLDGQTVAVLKIRLFSPQGFPLYCEAAIRQLHLDIDRPCNEHCGDRISASASAQMTIDLAQALTAVKAAGTRILMVDLAGNGGGSEWAEAAARMVTAVRVESIPTYFVRGEHWVRRLARQEQDLRRAATNSPAADRQFLLRLADTVAERKREAGTPCDSAPLWNGGLMKCAWLGNGFYSTGLLRSGVSVELRSKPWGPLAFTPLQYPYQEGLWAGPLLVVVSGDTGSAAEQFAAELQDNHAAIIVGSPTVGAGCGMTDGGTPTTLRHSGAILLLPDCVRIRDSGANLASGVQPDVLVGFRALDSTRRQASLLRAKLPEAIRLAIDQAAASSTASSASRSDRTAW